MTQQCRTDGRCQYAIDHGAEGLGHCPIGQCAYSEKAPTRASCGVDSSAESAKPQGSQVASPAEALPSATLHKQIASEFLKAAGDAELPIMIAIAPQWLRETARALDELAAKRAHLQEQGKLYRELEAKLAAALRERDEAVRAEREACADICNERGAWMSEKAIRARAGGREPK